MALTDALDKGTEEEPFVITAIGVEASEDGGHKHIWCVALKGWDVMARVEDVCQAIRNGKHFVTDADPPARVHVTKCPNCELGEYLTTSPDGTTRNNLLDLPRLFEITPE